MSIEWSPVHPKPLSTVCFQPLSFVVGPFPSNDDIKGGGEKIKIKQINSLVWVMSLFSYEWCELSLSLSLKYRGLPARSVYLHLRQFWEKRKRRFWTAVTFAPFRLHGSYFETFLANIFTLGVQYSETLASLLPFKNCLWVTCVSASQFWHYC